jgi:hypothetical protein
VSEGTELETHDGSRRDFLKKSLVAGAAVWAAPAVASLPGGKAFAQQYAACTCAGNAYGLKVVLTGLVNVNQTYGVDGCVVGPISVINNATAAISASAVCGSDTSSQGGACGAQATIATLSVRLGPDPIGPILPPFLLNATVIESHASATCIGLCHTVGGSTIANLQIGGTLLGGSLHTIATAGCNTNVLGLGIIKLNEQFCSGSTINVNAIHITLNLAGILTADITVAHSDASASRTGQPPCPCHICA